MERTTRRGLLAGAVLALGASAGCAARDEGPGARAAGDADRDPELHLGETVGDLPEAPGDRAFGLTGGGVYQFAEDQWEHVEFGTPAEPVSALQAERATVGADPTGRSLISNGDRTIYVDPVDGDDGVAGTEDAPVATIQEAVGRVPIYLRDQYTIDLATVPDTPVTYDEDVLVPTVIGTGQAGREEDAPEAGPIKNLVLRGAGDDPEAVRIGSLLFGNVVGTSVGLVQSATFERDSPYDDEGRALSAYGSGEVHLYDVGFTDGPTGGVLAYGSKMKASIVDLGTDDLETGIHAKRHGSVVARDVDGVVSGAAYKARQNAMISVVRGNDLTGDPTYDTRSGGLVHDQSSDAWHGFDTGNRAVTAVRDEPVAPEPGAVWYADGSGQREEGFYGRTGDGDVRLG